MSAADSVQQGENIIAEQNRFSSTEPGLTHPTQNSHIRLRDNGDIEFIAGDGVAMIMGLSRRTITFMADSIKFMTQDKSGLRWNDLGFNPKATQYSQPTFLQLTDDHVVDLYGGFSQYVPSSKDPNAINAWKGNNTGNT